MFRYAEEVLLGYARLLRYRPTLHARAVPFVCEELSSNRSCKLHRKGAKPAQVRLGETVCSFRPPRRSAAGSQRIHTLYAASLGLPSRPSRASTGFDAEGLHSPSVLRVVQSPDGFRSEV